MDASPGPQRQQSYTDRTGIHTECNPSLFRDLGVLLGDRMPAGCVEPAFAVLANMFYRCGTWHSLRDSLLCTRVPEGSAFYVRSGEPHVSLHLACYRMRPPSRDYPRGCQGHLRYGEALAAYPLE